MLIKWFGHCTFMLQDSMGHRILTDPYNKYIFNKLLPLNPSIITISKSNLSFNNYLSKTINSTIIDTASIYDTSVTTIYGLESFCDNYNGLKRGKNIIYKYNFDNNIIVYLGYLGSIPNNDLLNKLKNCDILFIPIGGHFVINAFDAINLIKLLCPKIIIPMYYRTHSSLSYIDGCNKFILNMNNIIKSNNPSFDTSTLTDSQFPSTILLYENNITL